MRSFVDYDSYQGSVEEALRDLPPHTRLLFGWSVCEHLLGVIDRLGTAEVSARDRLAQLINDGWQRLLEGQPPVPDTLTLERLIPTDASGVGLGGPGVSEISELGRCMSQFTDADRGECLPVGRIAADAVSALWEYGNADETEVSTQRALADALRRRPDLPAEEVRRLARQAGGDLGEQVRVFVEG